MCPLFLDPYHCGCHHCLISMISSLPPFSWEDGENPELITNFNGPKNPAHYLTSAELPMPSHFSVLIPLSFNPLHFSLQNPLMKKKSPEMMFALILFPPHKKGLKHALFPSGVSSKFSQNSPSKARFLCPTPLGFLNIARSILNFDCSLSLHFSWILNPFFRFPPSFFVISSVFRGKHLSHAKKVA